jgi:hypothetical protein
MQRPLRAIVVVPANGPRLRLGLDQRAEGSPYRRLLAMPALADPRRIDMLGHVVCVRVGEEPGDECGHHGRKYESSRARQCASCNARKGRVMVAGARLADGPDRVYVSGDEEEDGDGAAAADGEAEEGQLEEVRRDFGAVGGRVQPRHERRAEVAGHDHEGRNAAQALRSVLAAVTQTRWGAGATYIYPIGVTGRHGAGARASDSREGRPMELELERERAWETDSSVCEAVRRHRRSFVSVCPRVPGGLVGDQTTKDAAHGGGYGGL